MINDISSPLNSTPTLEELGWLGALLWRPHIDRTPITASRAGLDWKTADATWFLQPGVNCRLASRGNSCMKR